MSIRHYPPRRPKAAKNPSGWGGTRDRAEQARFRRMLIERDGFRCWTCGVAPTNADPLQAHHVTDTDGRLLCREHHRAVDPYAR